MPVRALEADYDPTRIEEAVKDRWDERGAYEACRKAAADGEPWYFIDGPPYTSGRIHLGTAWNKVMKDLVLRWRRMQGYRVRDQAGWDMHGLPIEVKVEQELGIGTKQEIEDLGVERFVEECRGFALSYLEQMTEEFADLGVWLDWDEPYKTIEDDYVESAWWTVKEADDRGLLYRDEVGGLTWCRRCETALANAEVEYEDRTDPAVYVKFPVVPGSASETGFAVADHADDAHDADNADDADDADGPRTHLVIWTTTSWTLPANVAVAVHPDLTYAVVLAKRGGDEERLIVHDELVDAVAAAGKYDDHLVLEHVQGADLEGLAYEHPFADAVPYHADPPTAWNNRVLVGDHVVAEKTGLVHTATGHGQEDFEIGLDYDLPPFCPVGEDGTYTDLAGDYAGTHITDVHDAVVDRLEAQGLLLAEETIEHSYGHCWRCKTPIIYRTAEQFFLAITEVKDRMLAEVDRVRWTPEWAGSARQRDWVEGARDWCISRQRYWGIPLPVWTCPEGHQTVVGSRAELADLAGGADAVPDDLHRPWIDQVTFPCPTDGCGAPTDRVRDILDVWFDSAVCAWAQLRYPADETGFDTWFPCDFIVEGLDQTRGWFYSQLCAGVVALDRVPYESVLMHGFVHDAEGRPMSKSLGNIVSPGDVVAEHGRDPFRFYAVSASAPWDDLRFSVEGVRTARRSLNILWNVARFATRYMALDGYEPAPDGADLDPGGDGLRIEDRWLLSRLQGLVGDVTADLDALHLHRAARRLESFVLDDLSRWYVRLVRDRTWVGDETPDKRACYATLHAALTTLAKLLNPVAPHLADELYDALGGALPTVTMEAWPTPDEALRDVDLEADMDRARAMVEAALAAREKADLKLRWPVKRVVLSGGADVAGTVDRLADLIGHQTNAKAVEAVGPDWGELVLVASPVRGEVGPTFRERAGGVMEAIRALDAKGAADLKQALETDGEVELPLPEGEAVTLTGAMVAFDATAPEGVFAAEFDGGVAYVDAERDAALEREALARELVRRVQEMRKELDLDVDARIRVEVAGPDDYGAVVAEFGDLVAEETRADGVAFVDGEPSGDRVEAWDIEGDQVTLGVTAA